jgi:hypothetical protein
VCENNAKLMKVAHVVVEEKKFIDMLPFGHFMLSIKNQKCSI